jgi:RNA polymerase-binding transcription factor DksA
MADAKLNREQLIRRRDEVLTDLERVNDDLKIELDPDPEEQAIEVEHEEVAVTMEDNLRRELASIEEQLSELGEDRP